jgi:hypothetical protein
MDDLARVESTEVAPSGIVAGLGSEEQDVVTYDNDAEEAPCPGEAPAVAAVMAAAYGDTRSIKPEDLVRAEGCDPEDRKLAIELIEKLRELMLGVFMHATEASYLIAYAHWYGELMSFELLKSRYSTIGGYADAFQLLAAVVTQIAEVLCGANVDIMQPRQAPDVLYFGYTTPAESAKATFDQCKDSGSPKCANTFTIYYAPGGAVSHWGLSVVCSGKGVNETATCFHDAALAAGGSPMWP